MALTSSRSPSQRRRRKAPTINELISEKDFQFTVRAIAKLHGWMEHVVYDSRRSPEGYPDLTLVRNGEVVWLELKAEKGKVSPAQEVWMLALGQVPYTMALVVRPSEMERIKLLLRDGIGSWHDAS